jgi:phosphoribosylaminoimidazole-succinocarboxamide synthase
MIAVETIRAALDRPLLATSLAGLGRKLTGKVRDSYVTADGRRYVVTTDRVSAFDRVLGALPLKGQVLQQVSTFWFEHSANIAPNHLLRTVDPNVIEAVECTPLHVEMVVRAYLTGVTSTSIWTHYAEGKREFCGHRLRDGLRKNEPLPAPLLTPSTKALEGQHDASLSRAELLATGLVTADDFESAAEICLSLFRFGQRLCAERGLILVDTKYELGRDAAGTLRVIDEMHTPDSSRFWRAASYADRMAAGAEPESFDKEYLRRWLVEHGYRGEGEPPAIPAEVRIEAARRYIEACEAITGASFVPDLGEPLGRMARNLGLAGGREA